MKRVPAKKKAGFDTVRRLAADLPDVEYGTAYGSPALKTGGRMFACMASHRSAEPDTLVLLVGFDERDELIAADPATYYLKDHYVSYPTVLVRLRRVQEDALRDLLRMARRFVSDGGGAPRRPARRRRPPKR